MHEGQPEFWRRLGGRDTPAEAIVEPGAPQKSMKDACNLHAPCRLGLSEEHYV